MVSVVFTSSGLIAFMFFLLLQQQIMIMETAASLPQFTAPDSSLLFLTEQANSHFHNTSNNGLKKNKFLIRKCCDRGHIYNFNMEEEVADRKDRCVKYSITESSSRTKNKNQIFIGHKQHLPSGYALDNFEVDTGFPRNCELDLLLQPDQKVDDLFYPLPSGQLIVPHRFWLLQFDVHCIEDYFENGNFTKPRRVAFICSQNTTSFPTTAIDNVGKLQLDFIGPVIPAELSPIAGRTVIRKCCDRNEVHSFQYGRCIENHGFATYYFDDLQPTQRDGMFFRISPLPCFQNHQLNAKNFNLTPNGSLEIGMSNSDIYGQLFSMEHYCIEDVVSFDAAGFPVTSNEAFFCVDQDNSDQHLSEFNTPEYSDYFSTPYETDYNSSVTPGQNVSEFSIPEYPDYSDTTYKIDYNNSVDPGQHLPEFNTPEYSGDFNTLYEMDYNDSGKIKTPKCCPLEYVLDELGACHLLKLGEGSSGEERIISRALNNYLLSKHKIVSNLIPNNFPGSCKLNFYGWYHRVEMKFEVDPKNELSLLIHLRTENYWDFKLKPELFCVDFIRFRSEKEVSYQPQIFYCEKNATQYHHVSIHYPVLLCISAAGLMLTLIIYFFVPAKGSAKLVTTGFGAGSRGIKTPTMAMMLTGRILLCHVFTLSLTFICLAIVQQEYFSPNQTSCVAIGYFIYGASIASFAWLTVYCFDYYRIFTGAFKVSNDMLFIPYSVFGWGVPIIALIAMAITQFQSTELGVSDSVNPNIGLFNCWFPSGGISALVFFYGPVGTLLVLDMICFLSLIFNPNLMHCWRRKQSIRSNKKVSKEQEDFKMALKLFFITGIPWVFELAAWLPVYLAESQAIFQSNSVGKYVLEIGNLLNALRGIVIFIIFIVLQRDVRHYLMLRLKRIFKKDCPNNVALQHSRGNTDGDPTVSTEQLTNRRISAMTSQTLVPSAGSEEQNNEQAEFYDISIL